MEELIGERKYRLDIEHLKLRQEIEASSVEQILKKRVYELEVENIKIR